MKHLYQLLVFLLFIAQNNIAYAQLFYAFSKRTATYSHLPSPTVATATMSANYEMMPVPAGFKAFNVALPAVFKLGKNGWIVCTGTTRSFAFNPFLEGLQATATTTVGYQLETTAKDSILKIEWRDVAPEGATAGEMLSFQMWLYKKSQDIEFHYGPSNVATSTTPAIQIALLSADFISDEYEIHSLHGNTATVKDSLSGDTLIVHNGVPANGTVYRFSNFVTSGVERLDRKIVITPNPATDFIHVPLETDAAYILTDMASKRVATGRCSKTKAIDIRTMNPGLYSLTIYPHEALPVSTIIQINH